MRLHKNNLPLTKKVCFLSTINTFAVGKIGSKNEAEALEQTAWQFLVSIQSLLKGKTQNKWLLVVGGTTFIPEIFLLSICVSALEINSLNSFS